MTMSTIDADGHIVEKDADIRKRLPERFSKRTGSLLPSDGMDTNMGGILGGLEKNDIETRLRDMDKEGIDVSVLFPTSSFAVNSMVEREYAIAYARAYNDFIAEVCRQSPRLKGVALVPLQDPNIAVEEANRAVTKLGLASIAVATQGMKEHLGAQTFWPLYEEMERLNVPLCVHNRREGPAGEIRFDSFIFMHTIGRHPGAFSQTARGVFGMRRWLGALLDGAHGRRVGKARQGRGAALQAQAERIHHARQLVFCHGAGRRNLALRDRPYR
jgi:predicted TIM-barrel fold metal-dependent hydrolase